MDKIEMHFMRVTLPIHGYTYDDYRDVKFHEHYVCST